MSSETEGSLIGSDAVVITLSDGNLVHFWDAMSNILLKTLRFGKVLDDSHHKFHFPSRMWDYKNTWDEKFFLRAWDITGTKPKVLYARRDIQIDYCWQFRTNDSGTLLAIEGSSSSKGWDHFVLCLDSQTGNVLFTIPKCEAPEFAGNTTLIAKSKTGLIAFNAITGIQFSEFNVAKRIARFWVHSSGKSCFYGNDNVDISDNEDPDSKVDNVDIDIGGITKVDIHINNNFFTIPIETQGFGNPVELPIPFNYGSIGPNNTIMQYENRDSFTHVYDMVTGAEKCKLRIPSNRLRLVCMERSSLLVANKRATCIDEYDLQTGLIIGSSAPFESSIHSIVPVHSRSVILM